MGKFAGWNVSASESLCDQPLIRICGGDGEYAEIQSETLDDANAAVDRVNEVLKKATGIVSRGAVYVTALPLGPLSGDLSLLSRTSENRLIAPQRVRCGSMLRLGSPC